MEMSAGMAEREKGEATNKTLEFNQSVVKALLERIGNCTRPFDEIEWRSVCVYLEDTNEASERVLSRDGLQHVRDKEIMIEDRNSYVVKIPNFDIRQVIVDNPISGEEYEEFKRKTAFSGYNEGDIVLVDHEWVNTLDIAFKATRPLYAYIYKIYHAARAKEYKWHVKIPGEDYNPGISQDLILMCKQSNVLMTLERYKTEILELQAENSLEATKNQGQSKTPDNKGSKDFLTVCHSIINEILQAQAEQEVRVGQQIDEKRGELFDKLQTAADQDMKKTVDDLSGGTPEYRQMVKVLFRNTLWQFQGQKITNQTKTELLEFLHPKNDVEKRCPSQVFSHWHDPHKYNLSSTWASRVTQLYTAMLGLKPYETPLSRKQGQTPEAFATWYENYLKKIKQFKMTTTPVKQVEVQNVKGAVDLCNQDTDSEDEACKKPDNKEVSNPFERRSPSPPIQHQTSPESNFIKDCGTEAYIDRRSVGLKEQLIITCMTCVLTHQIDAVRNGEEDNLDVEQFENSVREAIQLAEAVEKKDKFIDFLFAARQELKANDELNSDIQELLSQNQYHDPQNTHHEEFMTKLTDKLVLFKQTKQKKSPQALLYEKICRASVDRIKEVSPKLANIMTGNKDYIQQPAEPAAKRQKTSSTP